MGRENGFNYEKPVHEETVSSFYMGKYEVTQEEIQADTINETIQEEQGEITYGRKRYYQR